MADTTPTLTPTPTQILNPLIPPTTPTTPPAATFSQSQSLTLTTRQTGLGNGDGNGRGDGDGPPTPASASGLYLYTFLATLIILLCVSTAIVIRSFILRRRSRRMAETTRSGIYITAGTRGRHDGGGRKSSAQHKPVFYDAYLDLMRSRGVGGTNEKWDDFLPIAAGYVEPEKDDLNSKVSRLEHSDTIASATTMAVQVQVEDNRDQHMSTHKNTLPVRVTVLIAMPNPYHSQPSRCNHKLSQLPTMASRDSISDSKGKSKDPSTYMIVPLYDEDLVQLPHIEFGVVEAKIVRDGL